MPKAKGKGKVGRPHIKIDWVEFDKLCALQCTQIEIAGWFECNIDTVADAVKREQGMDYSEYYKNKAAKGKMSLRRKQMKIALDGNVGMLIWLGKQYLDQKETMHHEVNPSDIELKIGHTVRHAANPGS